MAEISMTRIRSSRADVHQVKRLQLSTFVVLVIGYEALARSGLLYKDVVPTLKAIAFAFVDLITNGEFYLHLSTTLLELTLAFLIGTLIGVITGIVFGLARIVGESLDPWVHYLAPTPKIVFLPVAVLFFGTGLAPKIAMGTLSAFFPVAVATYAAMRLTRVILLKVARSFGASKGQLVKVVYLPSLVTPIVGAMRLGFGAAIIGVLLTEMKLSTVGLGSIIAQDFDFFRIPEMYSVLIIIFVLAWSGNALFSAIDRRLSIYHT